MGKAIPERLADLEPHPENPREISEEALEALGASIEEYGDLSGIVYNKRDGYLITGHQRLKKLRALYGQDWPIATIAGMTEPAGRIILPEGDTFSIRIVDWPAGKAAKARIVANSELNQGTWDVEELVSQLPDLIDDDMELAERLGLSQLLETLEPNEEPLTNSRGCSRERRSRRSLPIHRTE
jgi:hypothetical protein